MRQRHVQVDDLPVLALAQYGCFLADVAQFLQERAHEFEHLIGRVDGLADEQHLARGK